MAQTHKLVFICGLHRSGTSLLHSCLRDHPMMSGFHDTGVPEDEGQHLQNVYPSGNVYGGPGKFGFYPQSFLNEYSALATKENAENLMQQWGRYWDLSKPVLVEKSPPNLIRTRFLQALFPEAYFIVLLRHPVAVSLATQKWSKNSIPELLEHWLICHERFDLDARQLRNKLIFKYEEFMLDPQLVLDAIYKFIGVPTTKLIQPIKPSLNEQYFEQWLQYRDQIKTEISDNYFAHILESRMMRFGYSLNNLHNYHQ
ncbi:MAG: sulfotransferase [Methylophilales bacterium]|nr:sulfotransferase [Methylophilales bacterium]